MPVLFKLTLYLGIHSTVRLGKWATLWRVMNPLNFVAVNNGEPCIRCLGSYLEFLKFDSGLYNTELTASFYVLKNLVSMKKM